jgi:NADH:ubiquinone oxidoreductase subunit 3 (subunit A)
MRMLFEKKQEYLVGRIMNSLETMKKEDSSKEKFYSVKSFSWILFIVFTVIILFSLLWWEITVTVLIVSSLVLSFIFCLFLYYRRQWKKWIKQKSKGLLPFLGALKQAFKGEYPKAINVVIEPVETVSWLNTDENVLLFQTFLSRKSQTTDDKFWIERIEEISRLRNGVISAYLEKLNEIELFYQSV